MISESNSYSPKLSEQGIDVKKLHPDNDAALIELFYTTSEPHSFLATSSWGTYAAEYFRESFSSLEYRIYGFFIGKEIAALWNVLTAPGRDNSIISSPNDPIWPPVFAKTLPKKQRRLIIQSVLDFATKNSDYWYSTEDLDTTQDLSEWQRQSLLLGAIPNTKYALIVDLSAKSEEVWSKIRKSYRPLINKAKATWGVEIITRPSKTDWRELSNFHELVAGRQTRSLETWEIQRQWVHEDKAFAIFLRDNQNKLVGAGLFTHNLHHANYFTGVYDRALFDQPIGHLVQWEAILELQRRGVTTYRLGERSFLGLLSTSTQKDLAISFFKEGFATRTVPVSLLIHKTN